MKAKLVLISPDAAAKVFKLALPTKIGRGQEAKLKLVHPLVSRVHCEIYEQDEQLMVRDMASLNGTFVDDQRVADEMALPSGCRLTVGSASFHVFYGADYDRPLPVKPAAKSDEPTKVGDETVPMPSVNRNSESDDQEDAWEPADSDSHEFDVHENKQTLDVGFLTDDAPPETEPAPAAKAAAKAPSKPVAAAKSVGAAKPAAAGKPAAAAKPASKRPPNPAEFADEDETLNSAKPFTAQGRPPAKAAPTAQAPAAKAPAAPAGVSDESAADAAEESSGAGDDPDLDDFLKSIM
jgi:hypothetical protein